MFLWPPRTLMADQRNASTQVKLDELVSFLGLCSMGTKAAASRKGPPYMDDSLKAASLDIPDQLSGSFADESSLLSNCLLHLRSQGRASRALGSLSFLSLLSLLSFSETLHSLHKGMLQFKGESHTKYNNMILLWALWSTDVFTGTLFSCPNHPPMSSLPVSNVSGQGGEYFNAEMWNLRGRR